LLWWGFFAVALFIVWLSDVLKRFIHQGEGER